MGTFDTLNLMIVNTLKNALGNTAAGWQFSDGRSRDISSHDIGQVAGINPATNPRRLLVSVYTQSYFTEIE